MLNQDKCHFLFSGHKYEMLFVNVGETKIWERDRDLKFDEYGVYSWNKMWSSKSLAKFKCESRSSLFAVQ